MPQNIPVTLGQATLPSVENPISVSAELAIWTLRANKIPEKLLHKFKYDFDTPSIFIA